jgi:hypothetical protein
MSYAVEQANSPLASLTVCISAIRMSSHPENPHLARTPAGGPSAYPLEPIPQNFPWRVTPNPCPAGCIATAYPNYVPGPRFEVHLLPISYDYVYLTLSQAPDDATYRADATPPYPWRVHSDALKHMIRNLMLQVDSEVVEVRKESHGLSRSRVTVVFETPDEI